MGTFGVSAGQATRPSGVCAQLQKTSWLLVALALGCGPENQKDNDLSQTGQAIVYRNVSQVEYDSATPQQQEWATAVGLLTSTSNIDRTSNGVPKSCPDKTQVSFACTAVMSTFGNYLCADELWSTQKHIAPACTAFMIRNETGKKAVFATAGHCLPAPGDCTSSSVVLRWRRSLPDYPGGNPNILEQHIYPCTKILAHGGHTDAGITSPGDWAVFEVDREVTGGGATGGPLTPAREALTLSTKGVQPNDTGTTIGFPLGLPIKIDPEVTTSDLVTNRGPGTFYAFLDAMAGQSGAPILNSSGEVVGISTGAAGPVKLTGETCHRQCYAPPSGADCPPVIGLSASDPNAYATIAVNVSQLPSQYRATSEHVMILLDQTGSMTEAGAATGLTRWDDAIAAATQWIQLDKLTAAFVERAYSIWTFRDDTVIGGSQTGLVKLWPLPSSSDCPMIEAGSGFCILPRSDSLNAVDYNALIDRMASIRDTNRPVVGPTTPLAHSLCNGLESIRALPGLKRIILESDGGENSTALADSCFGNPSAPFGDWSADLSLRQLADWGMDLNSWQAKVVRRSTRLSSPIADAVSSPLTSNDWFPFDMIWNVDVHFGVTLPTATFARVAASHASEITSTPAFTASTRTVAALATAAVVDSESALFQGLGHANSRSTFTRYAPGSVDFGVPHPVSGDVDNNSCVNSQDLCSMMAADVWQHRAVAPNASAIQADLDADGWVNDRDLEVLVSAWGNGCSTQIPPLDLDIDTTKCNAQYSSRWLSFEDATRPWSVGAGSAILTASSAISSDRQNSLQVDGCQYLVINSPKFSTTELGVGTQVGFDIRLPASQENPFWLGDVQLHLSIPSAGVFNAWLGQNLLTGMSLEQWHTVWFELPQSIRTALANKHNDAQFHVVLNTGNCATPLHIDNLRTLP